MEGIKLRARVGADGVLNLQVPTKMRDTEVEIFLVLQSACSGTGAGWPPGFFEEVAGGWRGEPLVRPEQGDDERRPA